MSVDIARWSFLSIGLSGTCIIKEAQQPELWPVPSISPRALLCSCLRMVVPRYLSQTHFFCLYLSPRRAPLKIEVPSASSCKARVLPCIFGKFTPAADPHKRVTARLLSNMGQGVLRSASAYLQVAYKLDRSWKLTTTPTTAASERDSG